MTELMVYQRRQDEAIDELLTRFDTTSQRAQDLGGIGSPTKA